MTFWFHWKQKFVVSCCFCRKIKVCRQGSILKQWLDGHPTTPIKIISSMYRTQLRPKLPQAKGHSSHSGLQLHRSPGTVHAARWCWTTCSSRTWQLADKAGRVWPQLTVVHRVTCLAHLNSYFLLRAEHCFGKQWNVRVRFNLLIFHGLA